MCPNATDECSPSRSGSICRAPGRSASAVHQQHGWRATALACVLLAACTAAGCSATPLRPSAARGAGAGAGLGAVVALRGSSGGHAVAGDRAGGVADRRRLLAALNDTDGGVFDAVPMIPVDKLSWLAEPPGGWETWQPPAGEGSVGGAAVAAAAGGAAAAGSLNSEAAKAVRAEAVRAAVMQVAAHMNAALAAVDVAAAEVASASLAPGNLGTGQLPLFSLGTGAGVEEPAADAAAAAAVEAAGAAAAAARRERKPAPKLTPKPKFAAGAVAALPSAETVARNFDRNRPFAPPHNTKFPPRGLPKAPPLLRRGCPARFTVKSAKYGTKGDGKANDAPALKKATGDAALPFLYFPVGQYRLTSSLVLTKPVVMGANTSFVLEKGVTLTLRGQPLRAPTWNNPMFKGPGRVVMGPGVTEVYPAWWSAPGVPEELPMTAAARACADVGCTVLMSRTLHFMNGPATWSPGAGLFATSNGQMYGGISKTGEGVILPAGTYKKPLIFTNILSFKKFGLRLMPGVANANIQAGHMASNNEAIVFEAAAGPRTTRDVTFSHISVMQFNQYSIVFASSSRAARFSAITVRLNFQVSGGQMEKMESKPSAGVLFRGQPPVLSRVQVIHQAIDPAQFIKRTQWVGAATRTTGPVSNFVFKSETWNGGYELPGSQVDGAFKNCAFVIRFAGMEGRVFAFKPGSSGNVLHKGDVGEMSAASWLTTIISAPGSITAFGRANPNTKAADIPIDQSGFYVTFKQAVPWKPGQQRTLYFHSYFSDPAVTPRRTDCVPFRLSNPGLVCLALKPAPTSTNPNRAAVTLINLSGRVIPAGYTHYFAVQM